MLFNVLPRAGNAPQLIINLTLTAQYNYNYKYLDVLALYSCILLTTGQWTRYVEEQNLKYIEG